MEWLCALQLAVLWQYAEALPAADTQRTKMTFVQREHVSRPVARGKNHNGSIGQADAQVGVTSHDRLRGFDVSRVERFQAIRAARDLTEQRGLSRRAYVASQKIVELGKDEG